MVGLPTARGSNTGELRVEPNVRLATEGLELPVAAPRYTTFDSGEQLVAPLPGGELLPAPNYAPDGPPDWIHPGTPGLYDHHAEPLFERIIAAEAPPPPPLLGPLERLFGPRSPDPSLGSERLIYAPFEIDVSQPQNQYRFRLDSVYDWPEPDRAEIVFAAPGKGPPPEPSVSFQDLRFLIETGGPAFSVGTEIPIRILDPEFGANTAGMGDMSITTKTVLLTGKEVQLTQIFRTFVPTGAPRKGLGNGHVSLEPGMLMRYKYSDSFYWHGELTYWFPLGGDPAHQGQVLKYGLGWSHLLYENDRFAIMDTMEFVGWCVLDGQKIDLNTGLPVDVDGENAFRIFPGLRIVRDPGGDLGVSEFGISGTFRTGGDSWYDGLLRAEVRWVY